MRTERKTSGLGTWGVGASGEGEKPGDVTFQSDGTFRTRISDNFSIDSQGRFSTDLGGGIGFRSDGVVTTKIGNTTIGSDGSVSFDWN